MIRTTFQQPPQLDQLREQLGALGHGEATVQEFGSPREISIQMPVPEGGEAGANQAASDVRQALAAAYPGSRVDAVETVSGKVSEELVQAARLRLLFAMIGVSFYIWFRFEWQFGGWRAFLLVPRRDDHAWFVALTQMDSTQCGSRLLTLIAIRSTTRSCLRPYQGKSAQISQDGNAGADQPSVNETLSRDHRHHLSMLLALGPLLPRAGLIFSFTAALLISVIIAPFDGLYRRPMAGLLKVKPDSFLPTEPVGRSERGPLREGHDGAQV